MLEEVLSITKGEPEMVRPEVETLSNIRYLSEIDHLGGSGRYVPSLSIYESGSGKEISSAKVFKKALAKLLVYYYPVAGRLKVTEDDNRLEVICNSEGVLFAEAQANCTLHEVSFLKEPFNPCSNSSLLLQLDLSHPLHQLPFLSVQLTMFKCGGFVVGMYSSHMMMDASGFAQFMKDFAEMVKEDKVSAAPSWERQLLAPTDRMTKVDYENDCAAIASASTKHQCCEIFGIPQEVIEAQKSRVVHESHGALYHCTTFEALLTLIWTIYGDVAHLERNDIGFNFVVNGRRAMEKVLPVGYYGNCLAAVEVKYDDVVPNQGEADCVRMPKSTEIIEAVRAAMKRVDEEYMWWWIHLLSYCRGKKLVPKVFLSDKILFNDWSRFNWIPDFGIGKGVRVVIPLDSISSNNPFVTILPRQRNYNGLHVVISLPEANMPAFKASLARYIS